MDNLLEVRNLKKYFHTPSGELHAVDGVSFTLERGKTLGVVGESGCGKSTLGRVLLGLLEASSGEVIFDGEDITHAKAKRRKELCRRMQIIFQDPFASLDPRQSVAEIIADPLDAFHLYRKRSERDAVVSRLMETVGLAERLANAYPHELDGGRRQRIGIARALALDPEFIVCDEPVSALDVSIQAQVLNLLQDLQEERRLTYIFITHDLSVVKHISDDILVMYMGVVAEKSGVDDLFAMPLHPYTKGLLSAIPTPDLAQRKKRTLLRGEVSSPIEPKPGCRFASRCDFCQGRCAEETPPLEEVLPGHFTACHRVREINGL